MSALLTHAAVGLLLGVALRLPTKYVPFAAFLGAAPDLDHLDTFGGLPFVESRITFHNVFILLMIPLAIFLFLTWRDAKREHRQLAAAAPVILSSHVMLDLMPIDPLGGGGWSAVFWPFSRTIYTVEYRNIRPMDPTTYSTFTVLIVLLALMVVLSVAAARLADDRATQGKRKHAMFIAGAYAAVLLLPVPGLALSGTLIEPPEHPNSSLSLNDATIHLPEGRFTANVVNHGGYGARQGALSVQLWSDGQMILETPNPTGIAVGGLWGVDTAIPVEARGLDKLQARLVGPSGDPVYATGRVAVVRGHIEVPVDIDAFRVEGTGWVLVLRNAGETAIPPGAAELRVTSGGAALTNTTNRDPISPGGTWRMTLQPPPGGLANAATITLRAIDDGHLYTQETRRADAPALPPVFEGR